LATKRTLAEIIQRLTDWQDRAQIHAVLTTCQTEPILAEVLAWLVNPIELNSLAAKQMKANFLEEKEFERQRSEKPLLNPPPPARVQRHLERIEGGTLDAWVQLCLDLTLIPTSTHYEEPFSVHLTTLAGWRSSDDATKYRILDAAKKYIAFHNPNKSEWIGKSVFHSQDFSGCKALQLLFQESPQFLTNLDRATWAKWAPVILGYPAYHQSDEETLAGILRIAFPHASDEVQSTLGELIDHDIADSRQIFVNKRVLDCWNSAIAQTLLEKAKTPGLNAASLGSLLDVLLSRGMQEAASFAQSLMSLHELASPQSRERAVAAAVVLLRYAEDAGWPVVWPLINLDTEFGRDVFDALSFIPDNRGSFLDRIDEASLGELYLWLNKHHDNAETGTAGVGLMGPSHDGLMLGQSVLTVLKARASSKAVHVLATLVRDFPQSKWLKFCLLEAQNVARQQTWTPLQPAQILSLAADSESRIIKSGDDLLRVVIESLERLQTKLHAEVPAVQFLWIPVGEKTFKPRDEDSLSDYIKIHLDDDLKKRGIVVNREVQIHRKQRTDIHVDAAIKRSEEDVSDTITVVVEVKGSWNVELNHAMQTQLVDKYLRDNHSHHGLYVVGWFASQLWDDNDWRKSKIGKLSIEDAVTQFSTQASQLSEGTTHVRALVLDATFR